MFGLISRWYLVKANDEYFAWHASLLTTAYSNANVSEVCTLFKSMQFSQAIQVMWLGTEMRQNQGWHKDMD